MPRAVRAPGYLILPRAGLEFAIVDVVESHESTAVKRGVRKENSPSFSISGYYIVMCLLQAIFVLVLLE